MTPAWTRRTVLGASAGAVATSAVAASARARTPAAQASSPVWPAAGPDLSGTPSAPVVISSPPEPRGLLSDASFPLWPADKVPGAAGVTATRLVLERGTPASHDRAILHVSQPILEVFRPANPNGAAIIVAPGGGYVRLAIDKEGAGAARRLNQCGVTAFVLNYRLPGDGWAAGYDSALQDMQRAIRLVRARARDWNLDTKRVGVMGFSAGGHLAAAVLTRHDEATYTPIDAADTLSARPDLACLGYAVMSVGAGTNQYPGPDTPSGQQGAPQPLNERVRPGLAPTFIVHAADDQTVPVANSLAMFSALKSAAVPVEMHLYQEGGHGFGFALAGDRPASHWPDAFETWARRSGFLG